MLDADPLTIKKFTTDIEDATPLGRLFDMDVLRPDGVKVDRQELALDDRFIAEHLSPGGSADLLALTYLLHFFKTEEHLHV